MNKNKQQRFNRINSNQTMNIVLIEESGNQITLNINHIRRYRSIDVQLTLIEMNSGVEYRVIHAFDDVDDLIESKLEK